MIVALLGKAGAGKTTIAEALEKQIKDCFIIDGDDLRAETSNTDISVDGRTQNINLGYSRARWLSDLGFTVIVAMQAPIREIREKYINRYDRQVVITNSGPNPKEDLGYNKHFNADYSRTDLEIEFTDYTKICPVTNEFVVDTETLIDLFFPKVLVIARFQGFHIGHKLVMEVAKRFSPNLTIGLRVDDGDVLDLDRNIRLLQEMGYNVIKTPNIDDSNYKWEKFVEDYDIVVQGNPVVIKKFQKSIDDKKVQLEFVPRVGHVSATKIREAIKSGDTTYAEQHVADPKVLEFLKEEIVGVEEKV